MESPAPSNLVLVLLHAQAAGLAGASTSELRLPAGATAADVKVSLGERHPPLARLLRSCVVATDEEYLRDETPIDGATRLHLVPPVSGG